MRLFVRSQLPMCLLTLCVLSSDLIAYSGGQGTWAEPYVLSSKENIIELASRPEDLDKSFILTRDIDMEGMAFERSIVAPSVRLNRSFGVYEGFYTGFFNGNGHVIENLAITGGTFLGFFGGIDSAGRVMHLGLRNVRIEGAGAGCVGMLAGVNRGTIVGCYAEGHVTAYDYVGGLVGFQLGGWITDSLSRGRVEGVEEAIGGLVGGQSNGRIERCYAAAVVSGVDLLLCGGLAGRALPTAQRGSGIVTSTEIVLDSFWDVEVSGVIASEGGRGLSTEAMREISTYIDAHWDFADRQDDGILDLWTHPDANDYPILSSFAGLEPVLLRGEGDAANPYLVASARELAAMGYYSGYFALGTDIDLSEILWSGPVLEKWGGAFDGRGHGIRGFRGEGACGLFGVIQSGASVANLCLQESEVKADDGAAGALAAENRGRITDCSVTGIVTGGTTTGGLVGRNEGTISHCSFAGAVEGREQAGGLTGENAGIVVNSTTQGAVSGECAAGGLVGGNTDTIGSSSSIAAVVGYSILGGLVGSNGGSVTDCYARGVVAGADCVGGLIGYNSKSVSRCYSTGFVAGIDEVGGLIGCSGPSVSEVSSCFWDMETSGIQVSSAGTGLHSDQMQDLTTFLDVGWDFTGETANGTQDLWFMTDGGYPGLTLSQPVPSSGGAVRR